MLSNFENLNFQQLAVRATDTLPPWVALLLVIALVWQLSQLTWALIPPSEAIVVASASAPATTTVRTDPDFDPAVIVDAHLFGQRPAAADAPPEEDFDDLEDTDLRLTLRGTIAANEDRLAMAIIADDRGEEQVYVVGQTVSGGRSLHSVLPDRAILNNNGKLEALRLPRESEGDAGSRASRRTAVQRPVSPSRANEIQQALTQNPAKLTDLIRPQPVFSDGKQIGYRVYPGRRRQQFLALGLKPGDLVTDINGTPLTDPARGAEVFRSMSDTNQVTVTVERNGAPQVLVLDPEQVRLDGDTK